MTHHQNPSVPDPLIARPTTAQVDALTDRVDGLRIAATALTKRTRRNEWGVRLTIIGLLADVALSVIAFFLLHNQAGQNARLKTSIHEQCSLYALIIPSYRDTAKASSPLGPDGYDTAYRGMQVSADNLGCGIPHAVPGT